jgi:predicted Zn-dependent protease
VTAALQLAERALAAAPPGDALALARRERSLTYRFARSRPTQATAVDDLGVEVAVVRDGHVGLTATNDPAPDALAACWSRADVAATAAARAEGSGSYPGFPATAPRTPPAEGDPETARLDPGPGGQAVASAFAAAETAEVEAHGIWTAAEVETAVASSAGLSVSEAATDTFMKVICIAPGGRSGYAASTSAAVGGIDAPGLAETAARKAATRGDPAVLPEDDYPVVLEPHAVGTLLELLAVTAFDGLAHHEGRGAFAGRLGTQVASPAVNLADAPRLPATLQRSFDFEGVPKGPLPLIQDGVAHGVVHDTRSAAMAGAESTGHARVPGGGPGPIPTNLILVGGGAADQAELCASIERGVYVTRLWYENVVRPKETLVTAMTRDGTFLIEDGLVTRPLKDMRLTDSVLGILSRTEALSARPVLTSAGEFYGRRFASGVVCPAIRVGGVPLRP